ncbi:MAG: hypothetical protein IJB59_11570 [Oscillospiraceae bacterium]|nr:hypothetical protein [Oscillospiraceae bacterium]
MEGNYGVYFGRQLAGKVQVIRQGLYYRFICRCTLSGDVICRLQVTCGNSRENLGVVIPMDGGFGLDTRIPVKRLDTGCMEFLLVPKKEEIVTTFVPISPEEPFAYLTRIKNAYLVKRGAQLGIMV